jgi:GNAT superfamily N-acetyltransferase
MHTVRLAMPNDAAAVSSLVLSLAGDLLANPEGEEALLFYAAMAPVEVAKYLENPTRFYVVAEVEGQVQGMIMVRDNSYIGQFFVARAHQGKGLGSALWRFALGIARQQGGTGEFKVNSTPTAVPIYCRLGFTVTGPLEVANGFKYIPMLREATRAA